MRLPPFGTTGQCLPEAGAPCRACDLEKSSACIGWTVQIPDQLPITTALHSAIDEGNARKPLKLK